MNWLKSLSKLLKDKPYLSCHIILDYQNLKRNLISMNEKKKKIKKYLHFLKKW